LIEKLMHFENQSIMSVLPSIDTKDNDMWRLFTLDIISE
jgi:hypothetical protein